MGGKHKYNAKKVIIDGHKFDSKKEGRRYEELRDMEEAGLITDLELQPRFSWTTTYSANDRTMTSNRFFYKADFLYFCSENKIVVEDVKGYKFGPAYATFKRKRKIVEHLYGIRIIEI